MGGGGESSKYSYIATTKNKSDIYSTTLSHCVYTGTARGARGSTVLISVLKGHCYMKLNRKTKYKILDSYKFKQPDRNHNGMDLVRITFLLHRSFNTLQDI